MKVPNPRKPRESGTYGALSHNRYAHEHRPTRIDVVCPGCGGCAVASDGEPSEELEVAVDGGISNPYIPAEQDYLDPPVWRIRCIDCLHRSESLRWGDLGEPFYQVTIRGETLWAWNEPHLRMLRSVLAGESVAGHPYERLATYVRGSWTKRAPEFLRQIDKILSRRP